MNKSFLTLLVLLLLNYKLCSFTETDQEVGEIGDIVFRNFAWLSLFDDYGHNGIWVGHFPFLKNKVNETIVEAVGKGAPYGKAVRYIDLNAFKDTALYWGSKTWSGPISETKRKFICRYVMEKADEYPTFYEYAQTPPSHEILRGPIYDDNLDDLNVFSCAWLVETAYRYNKYPLASDDGSLEIVNAFMLFPSHQWASPKLDAAKISSPILNVKKPKSEKNSCKLNQQGEFEFSLKDSESGIFKHDIY
ncbi:MAG: hypothetical protein PHQ23_07940, partial [Candidatus Wallbacteria bacterium]|nr:hypothetical protein [Candidatus Wallbacteria bacterium]